MKLDRDYIYLNISLSAKQKEYYGVQYSKKHLAWKFPKSLEALNEIEKSFPKLNDLDQYQTIKKQLTDQRQALKALKAGKPAATGGAGAGAGAELRAYQLQDVHYLKSIPSAAVLNQPRTGKTPTIIETIRQRGTMFNLIITPASLQHNWKKEIERWHDSAHVYIYAGKHRKEILTTARNDSANFSTYLIVSKDTIKRDTEHFMNHVYDTMVIDEAHFLRNRKTKQTEALNEIGKRVKHRYALTGTPTVKHPVDIFGILHFLYPDKFSSYWDFIKRYFHTASNGFAVEVGHLKPHREAELKDIIDAISTQRQRKDVMEWLPDKQRTTHTVTLNDKQQKIYDQMLNDFFISNETIEIDTINILSQLMRLRQICAEPKLMNEELNIPSAKTEALMEAIENNTYADQDEPLIIMSMFTSYLNMLKPDLEKLGKRVGMITGQQTNEEKQQAAEDFQAGRIDILLCNIISAGTGFTLDRGEVIIFLDKAWNPSDNEQAEDRITPTQKERLHKHTIVSFVCENTVEVKIEKTLNDKNALTSLINQCKSVDDLRKLLL